MGQIFPAATTMYTAAICTQVLSDLDLGDMTLGQGHETLVS